MANELLATAYEEVDKRKAERLRDCASSLVFRVYEDGEMRLDAMSSCRVRLCPMCAWRRSLRNFYNNMKIAQWLEQNGGGEWIALTLTSKSVTGDMLSEEIDKLFYAFKKFMQMKEIKSAVKGFYRGLEVTHDGAEFLTKESFQKRGKWLRKNGYKVGDRNPTFDLFHPHFHVLVHVNRSYFNDSRIYLSIEKWLLAWKSALAVDYLPSIKVQKVEDLGNGVSGSIAEISKYSVKSSDYIIPDDWDLTVETVRVLDKALANRRLIAYGGDCRKAKFILNLEDADDGDLVDVGDEKPSEDKPYQLRIWFWNTGFREYMG